MRESAWAVLAMLAVPLAGLAGPATTREEIESDWLRQNELRSRPAAPLGGATPEEDSRGGCDGVKDGKWGFHTRHEEGPWWQIDLGQAAAIDRIVLFNRCDACAPRNNRILILLSGNAADWKQVYQHGGTTFFGHSDGKPLAVPLSGRQARYVRLQLPDTNYFHLDEVEIYTPGEADPRA